ncbi:MAG: hypothetical protein HOW73_31245 [Polyangiaceae bacterium]|nr:hypothetical protein [Polyangiaceae bacterium]
MRATSLFAFAAASFVVARAGAQPAVSATSHDDEPWVYAPPPPEEPSAEVFELPSHLPTIEERAWEQRQRDLLAFEERKKAASDAGLGLAVTGFVLFAGGYFTSMAMAVVRDARCPRDESCSYSQWSFIPVVNSLAAIGMFEDDAASTGVTVGLFASQLLGIALVPAGLWLHHNPEQFFPSAPSVSVGPGSFRMTWQL